MYIKLYGKVISRTVVGDSGVRVGEGEGRGRFLPEVREFITDTKPRTNTTRVFFNGRFIIGNDYVRMYVTLVDSSWVVVAGVLTGVDFIPLKFCGLPSSLALGVGALVCPGRGRASAPRLRVVPRVQVAHCPVDLLYADTRRPSSGWRGPSKGLWRS